MLVISRGRDEVLVLSIDGAEVARVSVADIRRDRVRIGIDAPDAVRVERLERIEAETSGAEPTDDGEVAA